VTKAKAISEEIAPVESSGGGSLLSDGAKLIDSLGRNAGTFLPMILGGLSGAPSRVPVVRKTPAQPTDAAASSGGLTDLAKRIQEKEVSKK
jgi:hypothetical protein